MKFLKKISLVYALQVFAVILLFTYAGASAAGEIKRPATNMGFHPGIYKDSMMNRSTNALWNIGRANTR